MEFLQENEREPSDEELSELLDITTEKLGESMMSEAKSLSLDFPLGEDQSESLIDILPNNDSPSADKELEKESLRNDILTVMGVLNERERRVLSLCFGLGCQAMTLDEIGENLDLTRERVRQLKMKATRKLSSPKVRSRLAQYLQCIASSSASLICASIERISACQTSSGRNRSMASKKSFPREYM